MELEAMRAAAAKKKAEEDKEGEKRLVADLTKDVEKSNLMSGGPAST